MVKLRAGPPDVHSFSRPVSEDLFVRSAPWKHGQFWEYPAEKIKRNMKIAAAEFIFLAIVGYLVIFPNLRKLFREKIRKNLRDIKSKNL
jgi:hypothetical protein